MSPDDVASRAASEAAARQEVVPAHADGTSGGQRPSGFQTMAPAESPRLPFFVVGIGASAGGLEALEHFFAGVSEGQRIAYVIIQHLSPDFRSMMTELLPHHTKLQVTEAEDGAKPKPNRVYLLPANKQLRLRKGRFQLCAREQSELPRPINVFFESLALDQGDQCGCVVLSGTGTDGTHGAGLIKQAGGLVLVQEPASARFDGMPNSVISTGLADVVLPPADIARKLESYCASPTLQASNHPPDENNSIADIVQSLRRHTGINFGVYKPGTIGRRIRRRMSLLSQTDLADYAQRVESDAEERDRLTREVLIGVTQFFRDPEFWRQMENEVIPQLLDRAKLHDTLRVWVAGCATGEEAYTLAMLLDAQVSKHRKPLSYRLFATDVRRDSLGFARRGQYPDAACEPIPAELRNRFLQREGEFLSLRRSLRDSVTFAPHNLLVDPFFTRLDLVVCRNVLIYLRPEAQSHVITRFESSLRGGAFLALGPSESLPEPSGARFRRLPGKSNVFVATHASAPAGARPPELRDLMVRPSPGPTTATPSGPATSERLYEAALSHYVPPGVAVDEHFEVLQVFGRMPSCVQLPPGRLTVNLLRMVAQPLSVLLNSAGRKALSSQEEVRLASVPNGGEPGETLNVRIIPTRELAKAGLGLLIFFEPPTHATSSPSLSSENLEDATGQRLQELEDELSVTRENLHAAVQDLEATNEELQATNEEMTSSNEELQSTNEELQSVNQELYSVNAEYQQKIAELVELYSDLETLLASVDAGVLFLDAELAIRRYNQVATRLLPVRPEDVGRPIGEIAFQASYPELESDVQRALASDVLDDRHVTGRDGCSWAVTIRPFRGAQDQPLGVIMTFRDVTSVRRAAARERRLATTYEMAAELVGVGHAIVNLEEEAVEYSTGAKALLGLPADAPLPLAQLLERLASDGVPQMRHSLAKLAVGDASPLSLRSSLTSHEGEHVELRVNVRPERERDSGDRVLLFAFAREARTT